MNDMPKAFERTGFNALLQTSISPETLKQFDVARVISVHKDSYFVADGKTDVLAKLAGKLIFNASSPTDYPATGDWVLVNYYDGGTFATIHDILPRKSLLKRKTPGEKIDFQLIAANIDVAFIIQSLNENYNVRRLERYLVMVNDSDIKPIVLLSKSDLLSPENIVSKVDEIQAIMPGLQVIPFSNENGVGLDDIREIMQPELAYCLLGSSGVGKTTLINNLIGQSTYKTKTVRKTDSKGRHATTYRQLIKLDSGAIIVDTPGMRELGNFSVDAGLDETFSEIIMLSEQCHFSDCTHVNEKGCAVLDRVENGLLSAERYQNYIRMTKESAYNEMSYLDKKKKDRRFGKHRKAVMKRKRGRNNV